VGKFASSLGEGRWSLPRYFVSWLSPPPLKTGCHQITEKLLSVAENNKESVNQYIMFDLAIYIFL
jgi:hypothetical protein